MITTQGGSLINFYDYMIQSDNILTIIFFCSQHCERLIQHLQWRLLEEQEKLAVAMKVDQGKDKAIAQLQSAWEKLVGHWKDLEEQRFGLSQQLQSEREVFQADIREISQVIVSVMHI